MIRKPTLIYTVCRLRVKSENEMKLKISVSFSDIARRIKNHVGERFH